MAHPVQLSSSAPAAPLQATSFPLRVYFGHHKCATGWTGGILREIALHMGLNFNVVNQTRNFSAEGSLQGYVHQHEVDVLSYANAKIEHASTLSFHRGIHVVRDPRDVLVSAYFSHRKTHSTEEWPELIDHRARLNRRSKEEGLLLEMEFSRPFFDDMYTWDYTQENVLELRMEDVTASPVEHFLEICDFLDLLDHRSLPRSKRLFYELVARSNRLNHKGRHFVPQPLSFLPSPKKRLHTIPSDLVQRIVERRTFEQLTGRKRGQENRNSHLRKGVPGDWKNHLTDTHIAAFKRQYNDLVLKLGYETDPDWAR